MLDYAVAMSRTPTHVTDELFAALREHFDERQLVELTNVIALENMRARFNSALRHDPGRLQRGHGCVRAAETPSQRGTRAMRRAHEGLPRRRDGRDRPPARAAC